MRRTHELSRGVWAGLLVLAVVPWIGGCGGQPTATVKGKVTFHDEPVKGGRVVFSCANGHSAQADIQEDGTYRADKVPVGDAKVAVQTKYLGVTASMPKGSVPPNQPGNRITPEEAKRRFVPIPNNYESAETSGLTLKVTGGTQDFPIPLTGTAAVGRPGPGGSGGGPPKK